MDTTAETEQQVHRVKRAYNRKTVADAAPEVTVEDSASQAYAMRIWDGQSPDVAVSDRVARVVAGLRGQGMDIDVVFPDEAANRALKEIK